MNSRRATRAAALALLCLLPQLLTVASAASKTSARHGAYHGWRAAQFLSNGRVEVIIVPEIGRVMQFRFAGEEDGPFWENRALDGKPPDARTNTWINFGGDKAWPAPQADWAKVTPRAWPPPAAFDSMPAAGLDLESSPDGATAILRSAVDTHYGIRVVRRIALEPGQPAMTIATTFEKVLGEPVKVAVWVVTQLKDPQAAFLPIPKDSINATGYTVVSKSAPPSLRIDRGLISVKRDATTSFKIGNDAQSLLWVGDKQALHIDTRRAALGDYVHQGNSAEIYTNPDALPYVELETLGPAVTVRAGDSLTQTNTYTLTRRTSATPDAEARKILGR
ncbi:MAG: hypothetical protein FJ386_06440 [Verrucomicrobia bacterium]|nr:hypothetical protein [Verrucomicrobiota bacterium]